MSDLKLRIGSSKLFTPFTTEMTYFSCQVLAVFVCYHFLFDDRNGLLGGQKTDVEPGCLLTLHKVFVGER